VPLSQIATLEYGFEDGIIWHRNRLPTVTVRADIYGKEQPASVMAQIGPTLDPIREALPSGYLLQLGGTVEDSARGQNSVNAGMPLFVLVVTTLLMLQLRSFSRVLLVWLTAPLGTDRRGAVPAAVPGAVRFRGDARHHRAVRHDHAQLGDPGRPDRAGHRRAVRLGCHRRCHRAPLPADRADRAGRVLAMIPLSRSAFFGPMAVAIMGGLIVATALTLLFLPALYAAWFRVKPRGRGWRVAPEEGSSARARRCGGYRRACPPASA
jgi:multidrug efflux pump